MLFIYYSFVRSWTLSNAYNVYVCLKLSNRDSIYDIFNFNFGDSRLYIF